MCIDWRSMSEVKRVQTPKYNFTELAQKEAHQSKKKKTKQKKNCFLYPVSKLIFLLPSAFFPRVLKEIITVELVISTWADSNFYKTVFRFFNVIKS